MNRKGWELLCRYIGNNLWTMGNRISVKVFEFVLNYMWGWSIFFFTALQQERKELNYLLRDLIGHWEELSTISLHFRREAGRFGAVPVYVQNIKGCVFF